MASSRNFLKDFVLSRPFLEGSHPASTEVFPGLLGGPHLACEVLLDSGNRRPLHSGAVIADATGRFWRLPTTFVALSLKPRMKSFCQKIRHFRSTVNHEAILKCSIH